MRLGTHVAFAWLCQRLVLSVVDFPLELVVAALAKEVEGGLLNFLSFPTLGIVLILEFILIPL